MPVNQIYPIFDKDKEGVECDFTYVLSFYLVHNEALLRFSQDPNNLKKCAAGQNKVKFWLNQPNITKFSDVSKFDCQYVFGDRVEKSVCTDRFPCGICKLPPNKLTLIKGLCYYIFSNLFILFRNVNKQLFFVYIFRGLWKRC